MEIRSYYNRNGVDQIRKYIDSLTLDEQVDAYDVLEQMETDNLESLKIKRWQGKVLEVYFYKHNRIFYVAADGDIAYLLHACRKQKNKTEKKDCKIIISRARELEKEIQKKVL